MITKLATSQIERKTLLAFSSFDDYFHYFNLENMTSTPTKCFCEKNSPNSPDFEGKRKSEWSHFYDRFQQITKNIFKLFFSKFHIWSVARSG
jgi:hypothetical protein